MKILLDENLPHALRHLLPTHEVFTVAYLGWKGVGNGKLLAMAADAGFQAVMTTDRGIEYEQNIHALPLAVVVIMGRSNDESDLIPLLPRLLGALDALLPKTLIKVY